MRGKFHMISFRDAEGNARTAELPRPEYQIGNAKHWPGGLTTEWQIRPCEPTDLLPCFQCGAGLWILAKQVPGVGGIYYSITLPPHLRRNTPENVGKAVKRAMIARPEMIGLLRDLEALSRSVLGEVMASRECSRLH